MYCYLKGLYVMGLNGELLQEEIQLFDWELLQEEIQGQSYETYFLQNTDIYLRLLHAYKFLRYFVHSFLKNVAWLILKGVIYNDV